MDEHHSHTDEHETTDSSRDLDVGDIAAVLIKSAILDGALVWLVADDHILSPHPYLVRSGCPVVCFDEIARLRGKTRAELQAIGLLKTVFPTGRVVQ